MHGGQVISIFIFFLSFPFGGILDTLPRSDFNFVFCFFFTCNQPQIYLSAAEKINYFFNFHYALLNSQRLGGLPLCLHWRETSYFQKSLTNCVSLKLDKNWGLSTSSQKTYISTGCLKKRCSVYFANVSVSKYWIFKSSFSPENWDPYANFEYKTISVHS